MKKHFIIICCMLLAATGLSAQSSTDLTLQPTLPTYQLDLAWHKTRLLIFPASIKSADRGGKYVLAETFNDVDNILKVKAGEKDFEPSNLQVVTADGKVYAFTVTYNDSAPSFPVDMGKQSPYAPVIFKGISLNSKQIEDLAAKVTGNYPFLHGGRFRKYGMELAIEGIYIKEDVLFFQLRLRNRTQIPYQATSLRFFIRDKKKARRTASQDREVEPLYVHRSGITETEKGQTITVAFPRFTIAESKFLAIELMEEGGDRNPRCRLDQKKLLKARSL